MRPRIAITTWQRHLPTFLGERTLLYTLADEYVTSVTAAGAIAVLLPHLDPDDAADVLGSVDGLVVAGGGDVHPSSYGVEVDGAYDISERADISELALLRGARTCGVPTLAICRGMQLTNVAFGGTLHQDVVAPGTPHEPIGDDPGAVLAARHDVEVSPGSRLAQVVGAGVREVNTIHHQAIDRLADGFVVTARAPDGVIEAIEAPEAWVYLGVQWHPEKRDGHDAPLFAWLAEAARHRREGGR